MAGTFLIHVISFLLLYVTNDDCKIIKTRTKIFYIDTWMQPHFDTYDGSDLGTISRKEYHGTNKFDRKPSRRNQTDVDGFDNKANDPKKKILKVLTNCDNLSQQCNYVCCPEQDICIVCVLFKKPNETNTNCTSIPTDHLEFRRLTSTISETIKSMKFFMSNFHV